MLDPRIAQRQIELEQRKKQQKNLQLGHNSTKTAPTPAISPAPAAPKSVPQPSYTNTKTGYGSQKAYTTQTVKQTVNKTIGGYNSSATNAAKGTVSNTLTKAEAMADSVYKTNSGLGNNEYTTVAQRQAQQKSLQEEKARQDYISRMQQSLPREYNGYTQPQRLGGYGTAYGGYGTWIFE